MSKSSNIFDYSLTLKTKIMRKRYRSSSRRRRGGSKTRSKRTYFVSRGGIRL